MIDKDEHQLIQALYRPEAILFGVKYSLYNLKVIKQITKRSINAFEGHPEMATQTLQITGCAPWRIFVFFLPRSDPVISSEADE